MNRIPTITKLLLAVLLCGLTGLSRADEVAEVNLLLKAGQTTEAMVKLDQFLTVKPKDPQLRFLKGVMLSDSKRTTEAIAVFTQLNEDYPELPEPYNNLAVLYAGQGQYEKARAALEAAVRGNPSYGTAFENLGDVYARLAGQAYARALVLDPMSAALPPKIAQLRTLTMAKPADARTPTAGRTSKSASSP
jgi:Flp pilus assembly protein TadD